MSHENVEVVRRTFEEFKAGVARGDPGAAFDEETVSPDLEWVPPAGFPEGSIYRGRDGFVEFWHTWTEDFEDFSLRLERLIDAGDDRVVGLFRHNAVGKVSGVPVELPQGLVYELEGGRVIRCRNYANHAAALEAVGMSE